jgi:hypothetical protein
MGESSRWHSARSRYGFTHCQLKSELLKLNQDVKSNAWGAAVRLVKRSWWARSGAIWENTYTIQHEELII